MGFFEATIMSFLKKNLNFFIVANFGNIAVECVSNGNNSSTCFFRPIYEVFWQKSRKIFNLVNLENMMKECIFIKPFSSF